MDELALVQASRGGDRPAFEELVRRTARLVFAHVALDTKSPHDAEDLTQETFLAAFRHIAQLENPTAFRPWLLRIADKIVIDAARHKTRKKRGNPAQSDLANIAAAPATDTLERAEQHDRAVAVLKSLPVEYRQPLCLRYLTGADYETIGRELGMTNGQLRGLLHRGLNLLRERMKRTEEK